jgi:hypothetical protein
MICRMAWRVVSGQAAADERSDEESEEDEEVKRIDGIYDSTTTTTPIQSAQNTPPFGNASRKKQGRR